MHHHPNLPSPLLPPSLMKGTHQPPQLTIHSARISEVDIDPLEMLERHFPARKRGANECGRREREPLREADVLEPVRVENLEEAQRRVARVLNIVTCAVCQLPILVSCGRA